VATIEASPALRLRERAIYDESERRLVQTLITEIGTRRDDPTPRVVAAQIAGVQWLLFQEFRVRLLRDEPQTRIRAALLRTAERAFDLLESGFASFGRAEAPATARRQRD
jgi:hypothetical protein